MSTRATSRSPGSLVFTTSTSTTAGFMIEQFAGGMIYCEATTSGGAVRLSFHGRIGSSDPQSFILANGAGNTPVSIIVQPGRCTPLPDEIFSATWVCPTVASGTATCRVVLKS